MKKAVFFFCLSLFGSHIFCSQDTRQQNTNTGTGMFPFGGRQLDVDHHGNGEGPGNFPFHQRIIAQQAADDAAHQARLTQEEIDNNDAARARQDFQPRQRGMGP